MHIVRIDRRDHFTSPTLPPQALERLESVFRACPWWRDRWASPQFRTAARDTLRESDGLVLIGPGGSFDIPPPFSEMFEPIELAGSLDGSSDQLKPLSGPAPTPQERLGWVVRVLAVGGGLVLLVLFLFAFLRGLSPVAGAVIGGTIIAVSLAVVGASAFQGLSGRWYLIPGAIAIVRRPGRRGQPARVTALARADSCMVCRYVTGKPTTLFLELWAHAGKRVRRPVSEREAMSALASWQSPLTPPPDERLQELAW